MKKIIVFLIIYITQPLFADSLEILPGEWELNKKVTKLYDTPMGAVYRFDPSITFTAKRGPDAACPAKCDCSYCRYRRRKWKITGGFLQFGFLKNKEKNKRYVVLDFKIRAFPAVEEKDTPEFRFQITRSAYHSVDDDFHELNAVLDVRSDRFFSFSSTCPFAGRPGVKLDRAHSFVAPPFEPLSIRVIFDSVSGDKLIFFHNAYELLRINMEKPQIGEKKIEIRNFGITAMEYGSGKKYRSECLEISPPQVYMTDNLKDLEQLPEIKFTPYPYQSYPGFILQREKSRDLTRKLKSARNPEWQYAMALHYLYSPDEEDVPPATAIDLLERAAKEKHVLALYELGVCYAYGYGVRPDYTKALRYLEQAAEYGSTRALVLHWLILRKQAHNPLFPSAELTRELEKIGKHQRRHYYEDYDLSFLQWIAYTTNSLSPCFPSPKHLPFMGPHLPTEENERVKKIDFCDYQIQKGYWPAYLAKAINPLLQLPREKRIEFLEKGVQAGDQEAQLALITLRAETTPLREEDFSPLQQLVFADDPWYSLLDFFRRNPDFPGVAQFLSGDRRGAQELWAKNPHPSAGLLRFLCDVRFSVYRTYPLGMTPLKTEQLFDGLEAAARNSDCIAQYWLGRLIFYNDLPRNRRISQDSSRIAQATEYLRRSGAAGFLPARYLFLEIQLRESRTNHGELLSELEEFIELGYEPALLLKAAFLPAESVSIWKQLAEKENVEALRELALHAEKNKSTDAVNYWKRCIQADRKRRLFDRYDPYWPTPYAELDQWYGTGNAASLAILDELVQEMLEEDEKDFSAAEKDK